MEVDRLSITPRKKLEGYKTWRTKQHTYFCGTRVQVRYYLGNPNGDVRCPNCGDKETTANLRMCPDKDILTLFTEGVDELEEWTEKQDKAGQ